jgi:hypothetical protein
MRLVAMAMMLMAATCCLAGETAYELSLDFSIDGKHVASPHVVVKNGVKSTIDLDGRFIDVLARERPEDKLIVMSFWIGQLDEDVRKILATPSAVALPGKRVVLKVMLDDPGSGMQQVTLAVTAQEYRRF